MAGNAMHAATQFGAIGSHHHTALIELLKKRHITVSHKMHVDESFWRAGADAVKMEKGRPSVVIGHHYDDQDDVATLPASTWPRLRPCVRLCMLLRAQ